jgi:transcriptional regulator with XRE-family HTH domain
MKMISPVFANRIKFLRKREGKTQADMSIVLGILRTTYGEYERGKILPPMDRINKLADYFSVSVDYLIGNTDDPAEKPARKIDVSDAVREILDSLQNDRSELTFYGKSLDETSREFLIKSLENSLELARTISKKKD